MLYKVVKVTNPRNVLVQIPCGIINQWGVKEGDGIEVHIPEDGQAVILRPKALQNRRRIDQES